MIRCSFPLLFFSSNGLCVGVILLSPSWLWGWGKHPKEWWGKKEETWVPGLLHRAELTLTLESSYERENNQTKMPFISLFGLYILASLYQSCLVYFVAAKAPIQFYLCEFIWLLNSEEIRIYKLIFNLCIKKNGPKMWEMFW